MTIQIAVRLPDELVDFLDKQVQDGTARSRAAYIARLLERDRRRAVGARDAAIYAATEPDEDLQALAQWSTQQDRSYLDA